MLAEYLRKIANTTSQGDAREESYSHLSSFIESLAGGTDRIKFQLPASPKKLTQTIELQKNIDGLFLKVEAAAII
jgi:hypothetical protein